MLDESPIEGCISSLRHFAAVTRSGLDDVSAVFPLR